MQTQVSRENQAAGQNNLRLNPKIITWILIGAALLMALVSLGGQYRTYVKGDNLSYILSLIDVDTELSLPTIYSVFLLFMDTVLLAFIAISKYGEKGRFLAAWIFLTLGFAFLTFDEGASIHEKLMAPISGMLGDDVPSYFYFTWVIPALAAVAALGILFFNFLKHLPAKTRLGFVLSAVVYLGGSLGMELVGGSYTAQYGMDNLGFNVLTTIEESLEMLGAILFIRTLLVYISETYPAIQLHFSK
ncbi:MAG: hypothetical protein PWQ55_2328 [Chloroflexota bacterium]|nr:hypothetical protein [Chloroflexota bacterium]